LYITHLLQYRIVIRRLLLLGFQLRFYVWLHMTTFSKRTWW